MAKGITLTIDEVKRHPGDFFYIFATNDFLKKVDRTMRYTVIGKRANQNKILMLSAKKYGKTYDDYTAAIRQAFIDAYNCKPAEALNTLAKGGEVAGKNWAKGIYGIGSAKTRSDFVQNPQVKINPETGEITLNGKTISDAASAIYGRALNGKAVVMNYTANLDGATFTSQFNKALNKYYAGSYSRGDVMQNADGVTINNSDASSIWENLALSANTFVEWLISLFSDDEEETELINEQNTLPRQSDGWVDTGSEAGIGTYVAIGLTAVLLSSKAFPRFWKKAKKYKK